MTDTPASRDRQGSSPPFLFLAQELIRTKKGRVATLVAAAATAAGISSDHRDLGPVISPIANAVPDDGHPCLKRQTREDPPESLPSSKRVALKDITRTSAGVNTPTATATACCVAAEGENKPSVTPIVPTNNSSLSWVCAFCGKDDCDFEASLSGLLGPKQPDEEWDLSEPSVPKAGTVAGNNLLMPYDKLRRCVLEILGSKLFLPSNKYIGDAADLQVEAEDMAAGETPSGHQRHPNQLVRVQNGCQGNHGLQKEAVGSPNQVYLCP